MPIKYKISPVWDKIPICYPAKLWNETALTKLILEIGPGRGDFLFHLAREKPDSAVVGVELRSKRYFKLIDRVKKAGLKNVCLIQADAGLAIEKYFAPEGVSEIHINFPDPWPKRRHEKKRLLDESFFISCAYILCVGGVISFVTDSKLYSETVSKIADEVTPLKESKTGGFTFPTFFAQKWEAEGRKIYTHRWIKFS